MHRFLFGLLFNGWGGAVLWGRGEGESPHVGCVMEMCLQEGQRISAGAVDEAVSQAGGR